jgi:hypothetical protein
MHRLITLGVGWIGWAVPIALGKSVDFWTDAHIAAKTADLPAAPACGKPGGLPFHIG